MTKAPRVSLIGLLALLCLTSRQLAAEEPSPSPHPGNPACQGGGEWEQDFSRSEKQMEPHPSGWGDPLHLSLRDALVMAKTRHIDVIVGNERTQQALERLGQAVSTLLPHIRASASETRQTRNLQASGITLPGRDPLVGPFNTFDARITLTQTLFDAGAIERFRAARIGKALSLAEYEQARQDAMALVAALYLDAQRAVQRLERAQALLTRDAERVRITHAQYHLGVTSSVELEQAQATLSGSLHQWRAAYADAVDRRLDLAAALGLSPRQPIVFVTEELVADAHLPSEDQVLSTTSSHPQVEVAQQLLRQRKAERAAELADALPRISANADYGASGSTPDNSEGTYAFGAQVSLPVFEGGQRYFRTREASSLVRESEARLKDVQQHLQAKALQAIESVEQAHVLVQAAQTDLAVAMKQLSLAHARRQSGVGSDLEVVEASTNMALARDQHEDARATYQLAQVSLAHALGDVDAILETVQTP